MKLEQFRRGLYLLTIAGAILFYSAPVIIAENLDASGERSSGSSPDPHALRSTDEATSATMILEEANRKHGEGVVDFDLLRSTVLKMKPPPEYKEELAELDGKKVRIRGFMSPYDSLKDMRKFMLFPFATGCYFCAPPSPREVVFIRLDSDKPVEFVSAPIEVEGELSLWSDGSEDSAHQSFLYVINDAKIKPLEG